MDRLTREEVAGAVARGYGTTANMHKELDADLVTGITNEVMALLQSLSQEAVRDEVLENVLGIAGMLEFQAKLALAQGASDIKLDAKVIVPKIVESLRALKREPNAAGQPRHLVRRGLKPDGTYPLADDDEPAPAAPDVAKAIEEIRYFMRTIGHRVPSQQQLEQWAALLAKLGQGWVPETVIEIDEDGKVHPEGVNLKNLRPGASDD